MRELEEERRFQLEQLEQVLAEPFETFCKSDMSLVKELKKRYEKTGTEFFHENSRYMAKKGKDEEVFESAVDVASARQAYHGATLDLVARLNEMLAQKDLYLMESLIGLVQIQRDLNERQHARFNELIGTVSDVHGWAQARREAYARMGQQLAVRKQRILEKHADMYNPLIIDRTLAAAGLTDKSGYLYKKSSHTMVRPIWSRRFFCLKDHTLEYYTMDEKSETGTVAIDLRLCLIRPVDHGDRRYTFEILSPLKTYTLQAENDVDMYGWVEAMQRAAQRALQEEIALPRDTIRRELGMAEWAEKEEAVLGALLADNCMDGSALSDEMRGALAAVPGNSVCADCRTPGPEWASLTFGILICIECSGIHRHMGVQTSRVKSLKYDYWEPDQVDLIRGIGNRESWALFEATTRSEGPAEYCRPAPGSGHTEKEQWALAKYELLKFVPAGTAVDVAEAIERKDLLQVLTWLTAKPAIDEPLGGVEFGPTPLQLAITHSAWTIVCLLMTWSADPAVRDTRGWSAAHRLAANPHFNFGILLMVLRKLNMDLETHLTGDGRGMMELAEGSGNVKLATVLRMLPSDAKPGTPEPTSAAPEDSIPDTTLSTTSPRTPAGAGVRQSLSKVFSGYPHFHRHMRQIVQQQYNYYHEKATRNRKSSMALAPVGTADGFEAIEGDASAVHPPIEQDGPKE